MCQQKAEKQLPTYTQGTIRPAAEQHDGPINTEGVSTGRNQQARASQLDVDTLQTTQSSCAQLPQQAQTARNTHIHPQEQWSHSGGTSVKSYL